MFGKRIYTLSYEAKKESGSGGAAIAQFMGIGCRGTAGRNPDTSFETTSKKKVSGVRCQVSGNRGAKPRRLNTHMKHRSKSVWERFGSPEPVDGQPRLKSIEYLTSTFIIPCSIFDIRFFRVSFSI